MLKIELNGDISPRGAQPGDAAVIQGELHFRTDSGWISAKTSQGKLRHRLMLAEAVCDALLTMAPGLEVSRAMDEWWNEARGRGVRGNTPTQVQIDQFASFKPICRVCSRRHDPTMGCESAPIHCKRCGNSMRAIDLMRDEAGFCCRQCFTGKLGG